jgi:GT2 family glycosyltransferase
MFDLRSELENVVRPGAFWPDDLYAGIDRWKEVGWLNGHFMAVRNEIIGDIGGLDEYYYTFQCEADWCLRIRRAGWKVAYAPDIEITHVGGQHSINSNVKSYTNLMRSHINRYYFFHKHYGTGAQFALRFVLSGAALLRLIRYAIVYALEPKRREEAVPKIRAYVKVLGLALKRRPHELPDYLRRENELATQCG